MTDSLTMGDVREPRNPADGTWRGTIISGKMKRSPNPGNGPEKRALFAISLTDPTDDVDAVQLEDRASYDLNTVYYEIPFFDNRANWTLKKFAMALGVDESDMADVAVDDLPEKLKGFELYVTGNEVFIEGRDEPKWEITSYAPAG